MSSARPLKPEMEQKKTQTCSKLQPKFASTRASKSCFSKIIGTYLDQDSMATCSLSKAVLRRVISSDTWTAPERLHLHHRLPLRSAAESSSAFLDAPRTSGPASPRISIDLSVHMSSIRSHSGCSTLLLDRRRKSVAKYIRRAESRKTTTQVCTRLVCALARTALCTSQSARLRTAPASSTTTTLCSCHAWPVACSILPTKLPESGGSAPSAQLAAPHGAVVTRSPFEKTSLALQHRHSGVQ
mmetsp:Transcript_11597/g.30775  ORF Transcript_11597/g.30775 Transcript_11597/m.30775 type:complete len:242 (+) Transcript_11597:773-1498(+)